MLALTEHAAVAIRGLVAAAELPDGGLRIDSPDANGAAPHYEARIAPAPDPGDEILDAGGAHVFLPRSAADRLDDKVLDVRVYSDHVLFTVGTLD